LTYLIELASADYFAEQLYPLTFTIEGFVDMSTREEDYVITRLTSMLETRDVSLYIVEISLDQAKDYFNKSLVMIDEIDDFNYSVGKYQSFLRSADDYFDTYRYGEFLKFYDLVSGDYAAMLETRSILSELVDLLSWADYNGLTVSETLRLMSLADAALSRGDFLLALQRAEDARMTFAVETVGAFNVLRFVFNNWLQVLFSLLALVLFIHFVLLISKNLYYGTRINNFIEEKTVLFGLMKEIQTECFVENKLSMDEYMQSMAGYENRLNQVVSDLVAIGNKKRNLFRFWISSHKRLLAEKRQLINLIKETQRLYLHDNKLEQRVYANRMKSYSLRLGEIEEQLAFLEAKRELKKLK
jgi:hypothetical protein